MTSVLLGVRLAGAAPVLFCEAQDAALRPGQQVVVEHGELRWLGSVVIAPGQLLDAEVEVPRGGRARAATAEEIELLHPATATTGRLLWESLDPPVPPER